MINQKKFEKEAKKFRGKKGFGLIKVEIEHGCADCAVIGDPIMMLAAFDILITQYARQNSMEYSETITCIEKIHNQLENNSKAVSQKEQKEILEKRKVEGWN